MLRAVFGLAPRQTEGLLASILPLLCLDLPVPDHSTIARRAQTVTLPPSPRSADGPIHRLVDSTGLKLCGPGEWLIEKQGTKKRRSWRALHLGLDADSDRIVAATLTDRGVDAASQIAPLLDQIAESVASVTGDGPYDRTRVYATVHERHPEAAVVAPPRRAAMLRDTADTAPTQRDRHILTIAETGRLAWQRTSGYSKRAGVECQMARWKGVLGDARGFHSDAAPTTEVGIGVAVLNRMLDLGCPNSVRAA